MNTDLDLAGEGFGWPGRILLAALAGRAKYGGSSTSFLQSRYPLETLPHKQVVEEYDRELSEIVATIPQRTGSNREQKAYYLATSAHGLNAADASIPRTEIAQEFAGLSSGMQATLLGIGWKQLGDPALSIPPEPLKSAYTSTHPPDSQIPVAPNRAEEPPPPSSEDHSSIAFMIRTNGAG